MLLPILLAVSLKFGTVSEPIVAVGVHDVRLVDVTLVATNGMTKTRVGEYDVYFRLPAEAEPTFDVIVAAHGRLLRLGEPLRFEGTEPPQISLVRGDVFRFELSYKHDLVEKRLALFIDLRGEPRGTYVDATQAFGQGACAVPDALFSPHTAMSCEWNDERDDFVCRQARLLLRDWGTRTSWRSFTLLGHETITNPKDVKVPGELLSGGERIFAGEGFVEVIPIAEGIDFYAIPSTDRLFVLHGWLVDHPAKRVIPVMTTMLEQPLRGPAQYAIDNDPPFTADHVHLKTKTLPAIGGDGLTVVPFTVTDAHTTALFWLGYDGISASLLRVATDAEEYLSCNVLVRPASAISEPFVEKTPPFAATFHVAGPAPRYADLDLHLLDDTSCGYDARVTWNQGFVVRRRDATHCKPSERKKLTVTEDGRVVTAALPPSP
ncbi:MAG: hypothetical protein QOI24_4443 [Acidobacteriota bacterium]|jgi:hypothetical protein|nr:hypothetical protein [Acidobacteriota bacterium]